MKLLKSIAFFVWQWVKWGSKKQNLKTIRMYFDMAEDLAKLIKWDKAANQTAFLAERFDNITKNWSDQETKEGVDLITKKEGSLNGLRLNYNAKNSKVMADYKGVKVSYSKDEGAKLGWHLNM